MTAQRLILDSYRLDIAKYSGKDKARAKRFSDAIPAEPSKTHKRFILSDLEKTGNRQKYGDAAQWLYNYFLSPTILTLLLTI